MPFPSRCRAAASTCQFRSTRTAFPQRCGATLDRLRFFTVVGIPSKAQGCREEMPTYEWRDMHVPLFLSARLEYVEKKHDFKTSKEAGRPAPKEAGHTIERTVCSSIHILLAASVGEPCYWFLIRDFKSCHIRRLFRQIPRITLEQPGPF